MEREYATLGTHYGWVLASNRILLAKMFAPADVDRKVGVAVWMTNVCERYEETRDALRGLVEKLEGGG
jgi:hypothetical protein